MTALHMLLEVYLNLFLDMLFL